MNRAEAFIRRLSLRRRLTLASAAIVAATLILGSVVAYAAVRVNLRNQVDTQLRAQGRMATHAFDRAQTGLSFRVPSPSPSDGGPGGYLQIVAPTGAPARIGRETTNVLLPVTAADRAVATGQRRESIADRTVAGAHLRVLTVPLTAGIALQVGRPMANVDAVLSSLRWVLVALVVGGTALAALLTRLTARRVVAPIAEVTAAAGHIEETGDLGRRLSVGGDDEVGQMARRFNAMLDALARSNGALATSLVRQRRLVADASHELRTPVTSLRTNLEVLREDEAALAPADRRALLDDVAVQAEELGVLVGDLMELAREGDATAVAGVEDVRLDEVVAEALDRARRHHPRASFAAELQPSLVHAAPERLGRAVNNLLDNAATHGGGEVEVRVRGGELLVRDHGPGIPADELPRVFDRFWRGGAARERAGSGLGLAIVEQVATASGGRAEARNAPGGGAELVLRLPPAHEAGEPAGEGAEERLWA